MHGGVKTTSAVGSAARIDLNGAMTFGKGKREAGKRSENGRVSFRR